MEREYTRGRTREDGARQYQATVFTAAVGGSVDILVWVPMGANPQDHILRQVGEGHQILSCAPKFLATTTSVRPYTKMRERVSWAS